MPVVSYGLELLFKIWDFQSLRAQGPTFLSSIQRVIQNVDIDLWVCGSVFVTQARTQAGLQLWFPAAPETGHINTAPVSPLGFLVCLLHVSSLFTFSNL